jgi:S1-C subfamily serine protease
MSTQLDSITPELEEGIPAGRIPEQPPAAPGGRPGRSGAWTTAIAIVAVGLLAGSTGGLVAHQLDQLREPVAGAPPSPAAVATASRLGGPALDTAGVVARAEPAIVSIHIRVGSGTRSAVASGTGIVLTPDGEVLTNAHVVQGATAIQVTTGDGDVHAAQVAGADSAADIALLRVVGVSGLATAALGRSADVRVGDDVVAIGYALDLAGPPSVTRGIVSAVGRSFQTDNGTMPGLIQTDAAISSGNSGGALLNAQGRVIGITSMGAASTRGTSADDVNFAIPIDTAMSLVGSMRGSG